MWAIYFCDFKNTYKKICERRKLESIREWHFVERKNEGRKPGSSLRLETSSKMHFSIFFLILKRKNLLAGLTKVKEEKKENSIRPKEEVKVKVEPRENGHSHKHKEKNRDRERDRTKDRDHDKERDREREKEKKREKEKEREKKKKIKVRVFLVFACMRFVVV